MTTQQTTHKQIDKLAREFGASVDAWYFKNYLLGLVFYRFISIKELWLDPPDRFDQLLDQDDLANRLTSIFIKIEEQSVQSGHTFIGLFNDIDFNSHNFAATDDERQERLAKLMRGVAELGSPADKADMFTSPDEPASKDFFADIYEYSMDMFSKTARRGGGEYYTPPSLSKLLAMLALSNNPTLKTAYDPACGSGSLLLKLGEMNPGCQIYGQELNPTTRNLSIFNMVLNDLPIDQFYICRGDTLTKPSKRLENIMPFDYIVSNPPFSVKWPGKDSTELRLDRRFRGPGDLAPKTKADLAFVLHSLEYLSEDGTAAIIQFPGVLYRSGAEAKIRKYLLEQNVIDAVIQLPENCFYGTSIGVCILILRRNRTDDRVLFINASTEFTKSTKQNFFADKNIFTIQDWYKKRKPIKHKTALATPAEIKENDYCMKVSFYVPPVSKTEEIDIDVTEANIYLNDLVIKNAMDELDVFVKELRGNQINLLLQELQNQDKKQLVEMCRNQGYSATIKHFQDKIGHKTEGVDFTKS